MILKCHCRQEQDTESMTVSFKMNSFYSTLAGLVSTQLKVYITKGLSVRQMFFSGFSDRKDHVNYQNTVPNISV